MVKSSQDPLDAVFAALADPTRRRVLASLSAGNLPVTELAGPHDMSLPGFMKHLRVLENAGLIGCSKEGRVVRCTLSAGPMREAAVWLARYEKFWTEKLDALGRYLYQQEELQTWHKPSSTKGPRSSSPAPTPSRRKRSGGRGPTHRR
ncbi:MAG: transcriptional regulator [Betaproteobacteria bacterium RIFCSPHIGHO2_12_FULL_69_13]|nr:MAG: transcriptional regulator [Betaproteobacteria bacterium RIFCSPHIGHO2_12_FULL_69_13]OGA67988.1 MAG: transcriptional regulator [Betaproteobacteria bacterium RIFCSPLOWO2_12_FULL_68_20]